MAFPTSSKYVIIGAGIHGLSTAYHLALELKARGKGSGKDIVVLDKSGIAAGASGIACGVVRNNYFQPAMRELMAQCVEVWESDPEAYHYHPVGYMQISCESMHEDVSQIYKEQQGIGYESSFIEGKDECLAYMKNILSDWRAPGITSVLHEKKGGYANNTSSIYGLASKAESEDVRIITGCEVTGFERGGGAVSKVKTDKGDIETDQVIVGVGPWVKHIWDMLDLPKEVSIKGADGTMHDGIGMWKYWCLEEGVLGVDPDFQKTNDGGMPPVIHVDTDVPLKSDVDGSVITEEMWGIYYKPDFHFDGIQGGAMPYKVETPVDEVAVDPYGPDSPDFIVGDDIAHKWAKSRH
ncbi:MAG: FAD-dependent oxidoreductase [Pseudomonadota bacterium]